MKPHLHAKNSVKRYGGKIEDYQELHDFIDSSKIAVPDFRHRAMLHSAWGCYLVEKVFGTLLTNSDGKKVSTRDLAEEHIIEDLGFIPTMEAYLKHMTIEPWMGGRNRKNAKGKVD